MRFGVQLPEVERVVRWPEIETMATGAEEVGFDSIWVGDHLLYSIDGQLLGPWEAWTQLAALAAVTQRVTIGPLVAALPFHPPAVLAKMAATINEISGGRLVVGLGAGWNRLEFEAFGIPFDHRVARFEEGFHIMRRLLAGEVVTHSGEYVQVTEAKLLPAPNDVTKPPLMIGSIGPRMLEITLPHVEWWNAWFEQFGNDPRQLEDLLTKLDDHCHRVGRDPATLKRSVTAMVQFGAEPTRRNAHNPIVGSARDMAAMLRDFRDLGLDEVQLVLDPITLETIEKAARVREMV